MSSISRRFHAGFTRNLRRLYTPLRAILPATEIASDDSLAPRRWRRMSWRLVTLTIHFGPTHCATEFSSFLLVAHSYATGRTTSERVAVEIVHADIAAQRTSIRCVQYLILLDQLCFRREKKLRS